MLHEHIPFIKWSLRCMNFFKFYPQIWSPSSGEILLNPKPSLVLLVQAIQVLQLLHLALTAWVIYDQAKVNCILLLLPSTRVLILTILGYLLGMGVGLAKKAGNLLNTLLRFERWLHENYKSFRILSPQNGSR